MGIHETSFNGRSLHSAAQSISVIFRSTLIQIGQM